jgi:hypothetical protein
MKGLIMVFRISHSTESVKQTPHLSIKLIHLFELEV